VQPAVEVRDLARVFGPATAVDGVSFTVSAGELFGVVGPDGAGKTTMLRILAGVLRPTAGDAAVLGVSVARDPEGVKPHIAYVAQRFGLYGDLTVRENIDFYADLYGVPLTELAARRERLYAFSGLGPFESRLAAALSGGMRQKLSICCALVHEPAVMILDEPTFGVDPISRRDLWLILHDMVARGVTVIVATAYLDEAERCDRVAMLHQGRIVALDQPESLLASLAGRVRAVRTDQPRQARDALRRLPGVSSAALFGDVLRVVLVDADRDWPAAHGALQAAGVALLAAEPVAPTLEDVFIGLVSAARG
jgi:ABC-2 type transport system ATP-binding protein